MPKYLFFLFSLFPALASAQQLVPGQEATELTRIEVDRLDKEYQRALLSNPEPALFNGQEEEFIEAYKSMLTELAVFLKENEFRWEKKSHCFTRIYLSAEGKIEYLFYSFRAGEISPEKEQKFKERLGGFFKHYQFPLSASSKFAQFSPVS